ncbi:hypothetical protein [Peribacillus frigoritolerans]|uniref:hypothetical protein n=1 Tax=Peribacillus frigoritolerans TaxID=450367 RepID=UPI00207B08BC|nr:hypothetical protein [Peribacillus frigoritolerans]USK65867.1 hypothetical protein LIT26_04210 [Peribacillus frigoritolerans]
MEILIKESEHRFFPFGHVYSANINSAHEVSKLYQCYKEDVGKRWNEVFFKLKKGDTWMKQDEFINQYFSDELENVYPKTEYLGVEKEDGTFEKCGFGSVERPYKYTEPS